MTATVRASREANHQLTFALDQSRGADHLVHNDSTAATTLPVWKADCVCSNRPSGLARTPRIVFSTNGLSALRFSEPYLSP
jgi:hypothetical protein